MITTSDQKKYLWLTVTFSEELPVRSSWPEADKWFNNP
jgi:hypothetical protein